jgi:nucleotide-binding universal stress UspA family protein
MPPHPPANGRVPLRPFRSWPGEIPHDWRIFANAWTLHADEHMPDFRKFVRVSVEPAPGCDWHALCSLKSSRHVMAGIQRGAAMIALKHVLVATDFGEASDQALAYGRELARTFGAKLRVLHVVENVASRYATEVAFVDFPDIQVKVEEAARARLDALLTADDRATVGATGVIVTSIAPASAIVDHATKEPTDIIVLGTHGRGSVAHFFMGSVAERVVRTAPCPVLTVRAAEHDFLAPDALVAVAKA